MRGSEDSTQIADILYAIKRASLAHDCVRELVRTSRVLLRSFDYGEVPMLTTLQIVTLMLGALAMAPAVAHALEFPGKMRLSKDAYFTVQRIYYPGFTIAGLVDGVSMIAALALVIVTPRETTAFVLSVAALILLFGDACCVLDRHGTGEQGLAQRGTAEQGGLGILSYECWRRAAAEDRVDVVA
jgi:hypothetical protein